MDHPRLHYYTQQSDALSAQIQALKARSHAFVLGEVASFLAMVACIVFVTLTADAQWRTLEVLLAVVCLALYVWVRQRDTANDARIARLEDLWQVYQLECRALRDDFSGFDDGQRYVDPHHAYTYDLDIFGRDSLFQRMSRLVTTGGADALARRLCSLDGRAPEPLAGEGSSAAVRERVEALAADETFRSAFIAFGVRDKIDTEAIREALRAAGEVRVPRWMGCRVMLPLAWAGIAAFVTVIVLAAMGRVGGMVPLWWGTIQFFVVLLACMGPLREISKAVNRLHGQLRRFVQVARLMNEGKVDVFRRLTTLLDGLDKRGNIMGLLLVDTFALYDFFLVRKFLMWQAADREEMEQWIDRVVRTDQEVTVATFLYNHPDTCWAEVTDDPGVRFEARALYHPFLGAKAVRNDFLIDDRHFYIITGANMAGKSTFLRSVGVNCLLARLGMPVFARSLRVSRFKLFSSMRTSDDLSQGISYFNAELFRLEQLIGSVMPSSWQGIRTKDAVLQGEDPRVGQESTLIILDEILKGTNSLDKLQGSRLFLEYVSQLPVSGIIATHDLELSKMEGQRFHNFCFEIELGTDVTYSYQITPGVARNQNATFLLRQILSRHNGK